MERKFPVIQCILQEVVLFSGYCGNCCSTGHCGSCRKLKPELSTKRAPYVPEVFWSDLVKYYLQCTTSVTYFSSFPAELFAIQLYCVAFALFILLKVRNTVFLPELFTIPLVIHLTSGSGVPDAVQVIFTEDPSL